MNEIQVKSVPYSGWDNCVEITNDIVDLIVTVDVGPRVIRYGFIGKENEMCEVGKTLGLNGGSEWRIYGGHRLWHSPEDEYRTYEPDNSPVPWEKVRDGIKTVQEIEQRTGIRKEMEITLSHEGSGVNVLHRLTNTGPRPMKLSVWSISAMSVSGKEVIPQTRRNTGLLPNRTMVLWPYTKLDDPRISLGEKYIILRQNPSAKGPLKLGTSNEQGWAAYFNHGHLFVKYYEHKKGAVYPDFGVSYETYTNDFMLEMETLSPLTMLEPGSGIEHSEAWELFDDVPMPRDNEAEIEEALRGRLRIQ